jgi:hypothetical protein
MLPEAILLSAFGFSTHLTSLDRTVSIKNIKFSLL